jgi:hypothetical protein
MTNQVGIELLDSGLDDILHFPWIISVVSTHLGKSVDDTSLVAPTLEVIHDLLESGYVVAGPVVEDENGILYIRSWEMSPSDTVRRIEHDWRELGRAPNPGEVVWLELTDAGRAKIHSISNLTEDERRLVEQVVARRRPELCERVAVIGQGKLNWMERQAFEEALGEELTAAAAQGATSDKQAEYVRAIRALHDRARVF